MSDASDAGREALHDWLDERDALRADERPDPSEYDEEREALRDALVDKGEIEPYD